MAANTAPARRVYPSFGLHFLKCRDLLPLQPALHPTEWRTPGEGTVAVAHSAPGTASTGMAERSCRPVGWVARQRRGWGSVRVN